MHLFRVYRAMSVRKQGIIDDIAIQCAGAPYNDCYIGITSDIEMQLVKHNVSMSTDRWICRIADTHELAWEIRQHFIAVGMDGVEGGCNEEGTIVYVYRKSSTTFP